MTAHTIERIILAVVEAAERRRRGKVHNLAGYTSKILANWTQAGSPTPRLAKARPAVSARAATASYAAKAEAERSQRRRLEADQADQEANLRLAWAALPEAERRAIEATVDREYPRPGRLSSKAWETMRMANCLTRLTPPPAPPTPACRC
jgi:hypothetical protein